MQAQEENLLSLMGLLGGTEEEAAEKLATRIAITLADEPGARLFAEDLAALLGRTLDLTSAEECDIEVALGRQPVSSAETRLTVTLTEAAMSVTASDDAGGTISNDVHGLLRKVAACYAAGNIVARAVGGPQFEHLPEPFVINFAAFGLTRDDLEKPIVLEDTVLVGGGGVGNGFMWAAQELNLAGELTIADPKAIGAGALNRCLFYGHDDLTKNKAVVLAERASRPGFHVEGYPGTFAALRAERGRVKRVITTPDSREVRRAIQNELPLEVLDASTTDLSEVVVHTHAQPTGGACLACIYPHIPVEDARQRHIAEGLGLTLEEVRRRFIDEELAAKLHRLHPGLAGITLVGQAFDSVYKQQCGAGALLTAAGEQAVAPLAFISNLAGALLALELVRFETHADARESIYQTLSPWHPPSARARRFRGRLLGCEFCGNDLSLQALRAVWPEMHWPDR